VDACYDKDRRARFVVGLDGQNCTEVDGDGGDEDYNCGPDTKVVKGDGTDLEISEE